MSSDYLDMPKLTNTCIEYIVDNINQILFQKEYIPCYKSHIAKNIARKFCEQKKHSVLDSLIDEKDMILSRLFKKKLELYFENSRNLLYKCVFCNELFTESQTTVFNCPLNPHKFISEYGEVKSVHQADSFWDLNEYVMQYRENKMPWKEIYWKVWAKTKIFKCHTCKKFFRPVDTKSSCRYHIQKPKFLHSIKFNIGVYECCLNKVKKFDVGIEIDTSSDSLYETYFLQKEQYENNKNYDGCCYRDHIAEVNDEAYLSPEINPQVSKEASLSQQYQEDLEHFWRNRDLICRDSKTPEVKSSLIRQSFEENDSDDENSEVFIEYTSKYRKEKLNNSLFEIDKLTNDININDQTKSIKPPNKSKLLIRRLDALRYDDRDSMKNLINNLKQRRENE